MNQKSYPDGLNGTVGRAAEGPCILVVDDDPEMLMIIGMSLERLVAGQRIVVESDPRRALGLLPELRPDLVITDMAMPGLDGAALARAIVGNPELSGTQLIGVTGMTEADVRETAFDSGIAEMIQKPFTPHELRASVCRALGIPDDRLNPFRRPGSRWS